MITVWSLTFLWTLEGQGFLV